MNQNERIFLSDFIKKYKECLSSPVKMFSRMWKCPHGETKIDCELCLLNNICKNSSFDNVKERADLAKKLLGSNQLELFDENSD